VHTLGHTRTGACICTMEEYLAGDERLIWNPQCPVAGHTDDLSSVDFSPNGKHFVSGSHDKLVKIWNIETGAQVSSFWGLRGVW